LALPHYGPACFSAAFSLCLIKSISGFGVAELLKPPGATAEERVVMALLEQGLAG